MENHANQNEIRVKMSHTTAIIYSLQSDFLIPFSEVFRPDRYFTGKDSVGNPLRGRDG
uniref:Uncharacterized protein n=1 Tax=Anguilla anguilla TaxID=7936 RepID=A0A0E9QDI3_ANGAN